MRVCAACGAEIPVGLSACARCGADAAATSVGPAAHDAPSPARVTVLTSSDPVVLSLAQGALDDAGISFSTRGASLQELFGVGRAGAGFNVITGPVAIEVAAASGRRAEDFLRAALGDAATAEPPLAAPVTGDAGDARSDDEDAGRIDEPTPDPPLSVPLPGVTRARRVGDLVLVLLLNFGLSIVGSIGSAWTRSSHRPWEARGASLTLLAEIAGLMLLYFVLARRGQSLRDLGLRLGWIDLPAGIALAVTGLVAIVAMGRILNFAALLSVGERLTYPRHSEPHVSQALEVAILGVLLVGAVQTGLILYAWTISELHALTGRAWPGVVASVGLQTLFSLQYGTSNAAAYAAMYLFFAAFYARFRRITPVIVAQLCIDLLSFTHYYLNG